MRAPVLASRRTLVLLCGLATLACAGLVTVPELRDVTREEALARGHDVPEGAAHVYVYDFGSRDVRSVYWRYELPEERLGEVMDEVLADGRYTRAAGWDVPASWPDFSIFGDDATPPDWWAPPGIAVYRWSQPYDAVEGEDDGRGEQVSFDPPSGTVHRWAWEWQWWSDAG